MVKEMNNFDSPSALYKYIIKNSLQDPINQCLKEYITNNFTPDKININPNLKKNLGPKFSTVCNKNYHWLDLIPWENMANQKLIYPS